MTISLFCVMKKPLVSLLVMSTVAGSFWLALLSEGCRDDFITMTSATLGSFWAAEAPATTEEDDE